MEKFDLFDSRGAYDESTRFLQNFIQPLLLAANSLSLFVCFSLRVLGFDVSILESGLPFFLVAKTLGKIKQFLETKLEGGGLKTMGEPCRENCFISIDLDQLRNLANYGPEN